MSKKYNESDFHPMVYYYNEARDYFFNEKDDSTELFVGSAAQKYINKQFENERACTAIG